jgi:hypothetical protein
LEGRRLEKFYVNLDHTQHNSEVKLHICEAIAHVEFYTSQWSAMTILLNALTAMKSKTLPSFASRFLFKHQIICGNKSIGSGIESML